jgi:hypothetical protein
MRKAAKQNQKDAISFLKEVDDIENGSINKKSTLRSSETHPIATHDYLCTDCGWHGNSEDAKYDEEFEGKVCVECGSGDLDLGTFPEDENLYSNAQCGHCNWMGMEDDCTRNENDELTCPSCGAEDDIYLRKTPMPGWFGEDRDLIIRALSTHGSWLKDIPSTLRGDKELVFVAVKSPHMALQFAADEFKNDKEIVHAAILKSSSEFEYASENLRDDKELALLAVSSSGYELRYVSERLRNDREVVFAAVSESGGSLEFASATLQNDREIVFTAVENNGSSIEFASNKYKEDDEIAMLAINQDADSIQYLSSKFKKNKSIAKAAVTNSASAFEYLAEDLRADKELAIISLSNDGSQYQNLSGDLKTDSELGRLAVKESGWMLEYLVDDLRDDKEIVLLAVARSGTALQFASKRLRADPDVVNIAYENDEDATQYSLLPDSHSKLWKITPDEEGAAVETSAYALNEKLITVTRKWREYVVVLKTDRRPLLDIDGYQDIYEFTRDNNIEIDNLDYHDGEESYSFEGMTKKEEKHWNDFIKTNDYVMLENEGWNLQSEKLIFESTISVEELNEDINQNNDLSLESPITPISCPSCGSKDVGGLQVSFIWFENNAFDLNSVLEESSTTRYFNSLTCSDCSSDVFEEASSYFLDVNKRCDQYEADEQITLLKQSLEKKGWTGEQLYLIVNKGYIVFSDSGVEDVSTLSKRLLSENDFKVASFYTDGKVKQDKIYKIKEINEDIILQQSE